MDETLLRRLRATVASGQPAVLATVVASPPGGPPLGEKFLLVAGGVPPAAGWRQAVYTTARDLLGGSGPRVVVVDDAGELRSDLPAGEGVRVYLEPYTAAPALVICGAGHIGRELAALGTRLGFAVTVLDDRPDYAHPRHFPAGVRVVSAPWTAAVAMIPDGPGTSLVLVTRGHSHDSEVLRAVAGRPLGYVGMIGSRRRVATVRSLLLAEGVPAEWLDRVRAPIGLDIGAETPAEIALAIAAEVIAARRGGTGLPLAATREGRP